jgi:hypothetical protein
MLTISPFSIPEHKESGARARVDRLQYIPGILGHLLYLLYLPTYYYPPTTYFVFYPENQNQSQSQSRAESSKTSTIESHTTRKVRPFYLPYLLTTFR